MLFATSDKKQTKHGKPEDRKVTKPKLQQTRSDKITEPKRALNYLPDYANVALKASEKKMRKNRLVPDIKPTGLEAEL